MNVIQTMTRMYTFFANSSLSSYLSYSSSVILSSRWNKLTFVRPLIDYVKNTQRDYQHQCTNKQILSLINGERCFNSSVFIKTIFNHAFSDIINWILKWLVYLIDFSILQVFGLGNKTYEHYNKVAIYVDKRLEELGATRVFELGLGDDDAK